jgi:hypothetical protein
MVQATSRGGLFIGKDFEQIKQRMSPFQDKTGDHITLLNVYNEWLENDKSEDWSTVNGIDNTKLLLADGALKKVREFKNIVSFILNNIFIDNIHFWPNNF